MSRIYDNKPLENLRVINVKVSPKWNESCSSGDGVILEGIIKGKCHFCLAEHGRYYVLFTDVKRAHRRKYDTKGREVEPNFSETHKVRTGYLNSSYKTEAKGQTDLLSVAQVKDILSNPELTKICSQHAPEGCKNCLPFWLDETEGDKIELNCGDSVRLRTKGNSPIISSIARMEAESTSVGNYAGGEQVGESWTDKITAMKKPTVPNPSDNVEGVDEDEWDD